MREKKYRTVGTIPKSNTRLSEQSQNQIPDCRNNAKIKYQTVGTILKSNTRPSEQSQNHIPDCRKNPKIKYQTRNNPKIKYHDRSLLWIGRSIPIQCDGVKLVIWAKPI